MKMMIRDAGALTRTLRMLLPWLSLAIAPYVGVAQQVPDDAFHFSNATPAFARGAGPKICIDDAHFNFHTADGRTLGGGSLTGQANARGVSFPPKILQSITWRWIVVNPRTVNEDGLLKKSRIPTLLPTTAPI